MMYDNHLTCASLSPPSSNHHPHPLGMMLGVNPPPSHYYHPPNPHPQISSYECPPSLNPLNLTSSENVQNPTLPRGSRNTEKRRERSKVAARCRRGKESEIFNELSSCLPVPEQSRSQLDKASVMRLTLCDLKLKEMMDSIEGFKTPETGLKLEKDTELFEGLLNSAISGFILVTSPEGDVVYVSEGIQTCLGLSQYEVMGQSLLEYSHPCDHTDVKEMLLSSSSSNDKHVSGRNALFRMKSANSTRGRNVHHRSTNYKVVNCQGRLFGDEKEKNWFVGLCEPLLHPSDVDIPLNKQTFLSKHGPDMKFEYVDESISSFLGYRAEDMVGKSLFNFYHACDGTSVAKSFKSLYSKGQTSTERTRFLAKGGGWMWVVTQATTINNPSGKPTSVVCIHFVTSGVESPEEICSEVQLISEGDTIVKPDLPVVIPVPERKPLVDNSNLPETLVTGPLLSKPTPSTTKIFAPRTEDMDTGFLMPVNNTLIKTKEVVPEDLTHLAPMAGDECVPIANVPLLDDLLQWLDAADMEYTVLEDYSEPLPLPLVQGGNCLDSPIPLIPLSQLQGQQITVNSATVDNLNCPLTLSTGQKDDMILDSLEQGTGCGVNPLLMRSTDPTLLSSASDPLLLSPFGKDLQDSPPRSPVNRMDFMSSDIFSTFYSDNNLGSGGGGKGGRTAGSSSHKSKAGEDEMGLGFPLVSDFQEHLFSPSGVFEDFGGEPGSPPHLINILEGGSSGGGGKVEPLISTSKQVEIGITASLASGGGGGGNLEEVEGQEEEEEELRPLPCKVAKQSFEDGQGNNKVWGQVDTVTPTNPPWTVGEGVRRESIGTQTGGGAVLGQGEKRQRQLQRYRQLLMNPVVLQALLLSGRLIAPATRHHSPIQNSRKRNFVGKLLSSNGGGLGSGSGGAFGGDGGAVLSSGGGCNLPGAGFLDLPSALVELTTLDCEVNAPLINKPLLDGPDLITALDAEMS